MLYPDINSQKRTQQNTTRYRTALYLRLSREDGDKTESDSIANQRTLLEAYAADHPELFIVDEFVDDGYSGSNFERPAFQRLFQELEQGTINCILVKDLSRFGRNYIEVGRYLERIFPVMRVRLIAVTDNYDSQSAWKTSDSIMVPMRNLLNDAYCRDISVKIKSRLAVKRKRGDFVGSFATYGYRKDPTNHSKLIVDELAAENVQSIFCWKISGMNNQGIVDRLNVEKVPSPAARKLQSGAKLSLHFRKSDEPPWSAKAVDRILHNEVYIGKLVQGKTRRLDYRSKKKMNMPMRDWVIVDNTHEAIIPAEQFELVRRILETETRRPNDAETVALFAGFLYCGDCGSRLVRRSASYKGKRYIYYQCSGSKQNKGSCTSHNLWDEKLHNIVRNALQMQMQDIVVIQQGTLKGFVVIHPNWSGISVESIRSLCLSTYLPEEVMKLNDIAEMRAGATLGKALQSEYMTVSGTCFINQSSPVMTISKNEIRFSKACHTRLDDCEDVELLYHPILQVVILRKNNCKSSTAMCWRDDNDVHSAFSARAFSGLVFQMLNWKMNYRYQCRGICRGQGNAKFLLFELDESRILTGKNQYEQENCSMNLKCRLYRSKWVQSITVSDVMESGQVVENPMIGAIPSRNEVQRELDDLLMSM